MPDHAVHARPFSIGERRSEHPEPLARAHAWRVRHLGVRPSSYDLVRLPTCRRIGALGRILAAASLWPSHRYDVCVSQCLGHSVIDGHGCTHWHVREIQVGLSTHCTHRLIRLQGVPARWVMMREHPDGIAKTHMPVLAHAVLTRLAESKPRIGHGEADYGGEATK